MNFNVIITFIVLSFLDILAECRQKSISVTNKFDVLTNSIAYETGSPKPHSQGLSINPYPEPNQSNSPY